MGLLVDSKEIKDVMDDFNEGVYDAMIKAKKTDVDPEKAEELKSFFAEVDKKQDAEKEAAEAEAEAKDESA